MPIVSTWKQILGLGKSVLCALWEFENLCPTVAQFKAENKNWYFKLASLLRKAVAGKTLTVNGNEYQFVVAQKDAQVEELEKENAELKAQLAATKALITDSKSIKVLELRDEIKALTKSNNKLGKKLQKLQEDYNTLQLNYKGYLRSVARDLEARNAQSRRIAEAQRAMLLDKKERIAKGFFTKLEKQELASMPFIIESLYRNAGIETVIEFLESDKHGYKESGLLQHIYTRVIDRMPKIKQAIAEYSLAKSFDC